MKKNTKIIYFLLSSLKFGGAERVALSLAKALKEDGMKVEFLLMSKEGEFLAEAEEHFNVVDLKCNKTYKLPGKLLAYLIKNKPDVLISSFWKLNLCSCLAKVLFPNSKLILWEHSPPSKTPFSPTWLYFFSASVLYQFSSKIVAVSEGVREDIRHYTIGLSDKLVTIYNPITPPKSALLKSCASKTNNPLLIISVGRLEYPKNPELLLEAFALVIRNIPATLLFVGEGSLRKQLEQLCVDLGVEKHVRFYGFSSRPYEQMIEADLFVMSSDFEGLPTTIIEALFCGLPVVSTDCPSGPRELLMDGKYGSLVPVNDKTTLATAIEFELKNRRLPEVQQAAAQRFLPSVVVKQFLVLMN